MIVEAAIAQWFVCAFHPSAAPFILRPGFESQTLFRDLFEDEHYLVNKFVKGWSKIEKNIAVRVTSSTPATPSHRLGMKSCEHEC